MNTSQMDLRGDIGAVGYRQAHPQYTVIKKLGETMRSLEYGHRVL